MCIFECFQIGRKDAYDFQIKSVIKEVRLPLVIAESVVEVCYTQNSV